MGTASSVSPGTKVSDKPPRDQKVRVSKLEQQLLEAQIKNEELLRIIDNIRHREPEDESAKSKWASPRGPPARTLSSSSGGSKQKGEPGTPGSPILTTQTKARAKKIASSLLESFRLKKSRTVRMSRVATDELLEKLDPKKQGLQMRVNDVFKLFQEGGMDLDIHCWCDEPQLFLSTAQLLLLKGEPVMADFVLYRAQRDMAMESGKLPVHLGNRINLMHAKALCGMNSQARAIDILEELYSKHSIRTEELLGLYGRCHKDLAAAGGGSGLIRVDNICKEHLEKALKYYIESFNISNRRSSYTGINAASMALLSHHWEEAASLADEVWQLCDQASKDPVDNYWNHATLGECAVIKRDWKAALHHYSSGIYGLNYATDDEKTRHKYCNQNIPLTGLLGTRRQYRLLQRYIRANAIDDDGPAYNESANKTIDALFRIPNVMALLCKQAADLLPNTSHLDSTQLKNFVNELHRRIEEHNVGFAYCSPFPGADILFAEAVLNSGRRVQLYVILPIPAATFRELVLRGLDGKSWGARLDKVLEAASRVVIANDMSKDITDVNLQYNYRMMTGMAVNKANVNATDLHLCYCDPEADEKSKVSTPSKLKLQTYDTEDTEDTEEEMTPKDPKSLEPESPASSNLSSLEEAPVEQTDEAHPGAASVSEADKKMLSLKEEITAYIAKHGRRWFRDPKVVFSGQQNGGNKSSRWEIIPIPGDTRGLSGKDKSGHQLMGAEPVQTLCPCDNRGPPQVIKAVLFADVKGFSKLSEHEVFFFTKHVFGAAADLIQRIPKPDRPILRNTWGDAFYFVFNDVRASAIFSLHLRDLFNCTNWDQHNLPDDLAIRISCHAAPVFRMTDSVLEKEVFTGVHTSRGARIEPITPPGSVYCSRAFAAMSDANAINGEPQLYSCPFIGNVPLAKSYGMLPVHVIRWINKPKVELSYRPEPEAEMWQPAPMLHFQSD